MMGEMDRVDRLARGPLELIRQAAGSPRDMAAKIARLAIALRGYASRAVIDDRLERLRDLGYIETVPNRVQLVVGAADMLRFFISPAAADYYEQKGINFTFHQVLRLLDEPASMIDPTGFLSSRDNIIGHVMQVVHANPVYDLQLLEAHASGLDELERQVEEMIAGTHPRAKSIRAVVEDPDYITRGSSGSCASIAPIARARRRSETTSRPVASATWSAPSARSPRPCATSQSSRARRSPAPAISSESASSRATSPSRSVSPPRGSAGSPPRDGTTWPCLGSNVPEHRASTANQQRACQELRGGAATQRLKGKLTVKLERRKRGNCAPRTARATHEPTGVPAN
jgi:hypothetical protein